MCQYLVGNLKGWRISHFIQIYSKYKHYMFFLDFHFPHQSFFLGFDMILKIFENRKISSKHVEFSKKLLWYDHRNLMWNLVFCFFWPTWSNFQDLESISQFRVIFKTVNYWHICIIMMITDQEMIIWRKKTVKHVIFNGKSLIKTRFFIHISIFLF